MRNLDILSSIRIIVTHADQNQHDPLESKSSVNEVTVEVSKLSTHEVDEYDDFGFGDTMCF